MKKIYYTMISFLIATSPRNVIAATLKESFNSSLESAGKETGHSDATGVPVGFFSNRTFAEALGEIIKSGLMLIGVFFLGLIIYAGYTWMIARGNTTEIEKAKSTIINATIGLFLVFGAYSITILIANFNTSIKP